MHLDQRSPGRLALALAGLAAISAASTSTATATWLPSFGLSSRDYHTINTNRGHSEDDLSSKYGFATGFEFYFSSWHVYPWDINEGWDPTPFRRVLVDMEDDGEWEYDVVLDKQDRLLCRHDYPVPTSLAPVPYTIRVRVEPELQAEAVWEGTFEVNILPNPDITFVSSTTGDEATGYLSPDGILDKPVIIVEGIDAENATFPDEVFGKFLGATNMLLPTGTDVLVYNFEDARRDIRENAENLLGLLSSLEGRNLANPTRVAGVSMGGVVSRWALAWAEEHDVDHGCDVFLSLDSPQQGAWVNLQLQEFIAAFDGGPGVTRMANMLKPVASLQLLRENVFDPGYIPESVRDADWGSERIGNEIAGTPIYTEFFNELNGLNGDGYPRRTLNVGVSNGAGDLENHYLQACRRESWINGASFLTLEIQDLPLLSLRMQEQDVYAGSYQPALRENTIEGAFSVYELPQLLQLFLPFFGGSSGHFKIPYTVDITGAVPGFIWANSALDIWGVERDLQGEAGDIVDWSHSKFDQILINESDPNVWPSPNNAFHDEVTPTLGAAVVEILASPRCEVEGLYPSEGTFSALENVQVGVEVSGLCIRDVDFSFTADGGATWEPVGSVAVPGNYDGPLEVSWQFPDVHSDNCYLRAEAAPSFTLMSDRFSVIRYVGPNARGTLLVHTNPAIEYSSDTPYCELAPTSCEDVSIDLSFDEDEMVWVLAAFPTTPSLSEASFGIDYLSNWISVPEYGTCGDFESSDASWPSAGRGTVVGWTEPQTHPIVPVYWFHLHSDFAEFPWFRVTPHDSHGGFFSDDSNPPLRDPIVGFGGFGAQGSIPCPGEVSDVELPGLELPGRHSLRCFRNPATDSVGFALDGPLANWGVDVYDVTGAKVHSQPRVEGAEWIWDLKDAHGDRIPTGVYFARLRDASAEPVKFTVLR